MIYHGHIIYVHCDIPSRLIYLFNISKRHKSSLFIDKKNYDYAYRSVNDFVVKL